MTPTSRSNFSIDKLQVSPGHLLSKDDRNNYLPYGEYSEVEKNTEVHRNTMEKYGGDTVTYSK